MDEVRETVAAYEADAPAFVEKYLRESIAARYGEAFRDALPGSRVLDVGCGPGPDLATFADAGLDAVGVDLTPAFCRAARDRVPGARVCRMDVRRLGFPDATFDGAWASASLLHLPKPDLPAALGEIRRVLVADGASYASLKRGTTTGRTDDGRFFARYRPAELVDHVEAAGFAVDERWADDGWVRLRCRPE